MHSFFAFYGRAPFCVVVAEMLHLHCRVDKHQVERVQKAAVVMILQWNAPVMQYKHAKVQLWVQDVKKNIFHLFNTQSVWGFILI